MRVLDEDGRHWVGNGEVVDVERVQATPEQWRQAYDQKVQDFATETLKTDALMKRIAVLTAQRDAALEQLEGMRAALHRIEQMEFIHPRGTVGRNAIHLASEAARAALSAPPTGEVARQKEHPDAKIWRTAIAWCQHNSGMDEDCGQVGPDDRRHACPERKRCPLQKSLAALAAKKEAG